jgi:hypothetical protein
MKPMIPTPTPEPTAVAIFVALGSVAVVAAHVLSALTREVRAILGAGVEPRRRRSSEGRVVTPGRGGWAQKVDRRRVYRASSFAWPVSLKVAVR